ncbi:hypothetical protein BUY43_11790 [Staphylococcus devriesei]|uniref:Uncharacterized protein n=1 Tax=Staphylococcus devriesei TaxID=586733 RepID=A0A2K4DGK0_9STAP|nr:hypothetical protein CD147_10855 [Staphylococcus devriesei]PTE74446.1 hypothetical protein BUY44_01660 [Staphylococcus devriesei]PTF13141.1 hypothetical protein BUY47_10270 [Staphylococcus devriesei]RIL69891.1 hypothetical protein BUY43_11790 [Staphylococcus devriesei]RIL69938.1 hypothetical protein BUY49_10585 [Staphylococcus devriesei]
MYLILAIFTFISAIVSMSFSIQSSYISRSTISYYALSRSLSATVLSIITLVFINNNFLIIVSILMILIQFFDGFIGLIMKNKFKTIGPFLTALINCSLLIIFIII